MLLGLHGVSTGSAGASVTARPHCAQNFEPQKIGAPHSQRADGPRLAAGDRGGEQRVELGEPLLEPAELEAAVDEQVLPELVPAVHLEHQPAEVAEPLLPDGEQARAARAGAGRRAESAANARAARRLVGRAAERGADSSRRVRSADRVRRDRMPARRTRERCRRADGMPTRDEEAIRR